MTLLFKRKICIDTKQKIPTRKVKNANPVEKMDRYDRRQKNNGNRAEMRKMMRSRTDITVSAVECEDGMSESFRE